MFSSKKKIGRSTKQISISFPFQNPTQKHPGSVSSPTLPGSPQTNVIVLKAKYDFTAKSSSEMSVLKDDYVKLLKRHGNGWLSVQAIEKHQSGLVPASYMDIAVNDMHRPVTLEWLYETGAPKEPLVNYVKKAKVTHASLNQKNKPWFKLDVVLMSGKKLSCAKYLRDFQHLLSLLQKEIIISNLPKLPESSPDVPYASVCDVDVPKKLSQEYSLIISSLNLLLESLLKHSEPYTKTILTQFIMDHRSKKLLFKSTLNCPSELAIINSLSEGSIILSTAAQKIHSFSTTAPLEPIAGANNESTSTVSSPVMSSAPVYTRSNVLYLSYLNQSGDHTSSLSKASFLGLEEHVQTGAKPQMVHSESIQTLDSINSLIQMFELSLSDEEDEGEHPAVSQAHSFTSAKKLSSSGSSLMKNSYDRASSGTRSSNDTSEFPNPLGAYKSCEPLTPTLGQSQIFSGYVVKEYDDISPLQPKMHQDYMLPTRKKSAEKDLEWSSAPGLDKRLA